MPRTPTPIINLQTFGMEIEAAIPVNSGGNLSIKEFTTTHDASIETPVTFLNSSGFHLNNSEESEKLRRLVNSSSATAGVELVSNVFDSENIEEVKVFIEAAFEKLLEMGESPWGDKRCGIHYHISLSSPSLRLLKNIVRVWCGLEDIIYTLAGMGTVYRGVENNSCYARPLLGNGIFVPYNFVWAQAINIKKLLETKTVTEFFDAWGDANTQSRNRYHAVRYYGLNLSAILYKGTVEFRPLNTNLNWNWNYAVFCLFQKILEVSMVYSLRKEKSIPDLGENSIYKPRTKKEMLDSLATFWELAEGRSREFYTLETILEKTNIPIIPSNPIRSHLTRRGNINNHWQNCKYTPEITLGSDSVSLPNFVDLHILRGE